MSTEAIVYVLTALAALVVVLTRLRWARGTTGRLSLGYGMVNLHTVAGALAVVTWVTFLIAPEDHPLGTSTFGIIALAFWWVTAIAGLLILQRWRRPRGRHAATDDGRSGSGGLALSLLAHLGLAVAVCVFTWAYLNATV